MDTHPPQTRAADGAHTPAAPPPGPRTLHIYRRFHPDYTGDGLYYTRLLPLVEEAGGGTGEFLAFETDPPGPPGPDAPPAPTALPVRYLRAEGEPATALGLARWMWRNLDRFDVVHLHSHVDRLFLSYLVARLRGRRVIYSCTLDDSPAQILAHYRGAWRPLARRLLRASIGVFVAISPQLLRLSLTELPPKRLRFIPQGTDLSRPAPGAAERAAARSALGLGAGDFVLVNVGSISRRKNLMFLVDALALVPEEDVRLVLVGPELDEDYAAELRARLAARGLDGRVVFAGFRSDMRAHYAAADAFVFASTAEGFPNVYLEAMAAGLPIVTRFLPGLADYAVQHGRTGLLADAPGEFAAALRALRADPARRAEMGAAARAFAERNLALPAIARRYAALYREQAPRAQAAAAAASPKAPARAPAPGARSGARSGTGTDFPDLRPAFAAASAPGPASLGLREFDTPWLDRPLLQVVIDTEADFDWDKGIWTDTGRTTSIVGLRRHAGTFLRHGARPTLVVDHPVATDPQAREVLRELAGQGCEIGVHLHTWTTPPLVEPKDDWHSFGANLGPWLERAKIEGLAARVTEITGQPPRVFKSGRYGLGAHSVRTLRTLGFETDLSLCPAFDYVSMGGPDFSLFSSRPGWFGAGADEDGLPPLLSLPTTAGWLGWARRFAPPPAPGLSPRLARAARHGPGRQLGLGRALALSDALYPVRLSPEGNSFETMRELAESLFAAGLRVFTLSMHSPSLQPGNTPYARSEAELARLLAETERFLAFFRDTMGGSFAGPSEIRTELLRGGAGGATSSAGRWQP